MKIYINREGKNSGPYSTEEVQGLIRKGEVHEDDMAWMEGMLDWTTVKAIIPDKPSVPLPNVPPQKTDRTSALVAVCAVLFLMIGTGAFVILTDPFEWFGEKKIPIASANSPAGKKNSSNGKGVNTPMAEATPPKYPLLPPKPPAKIMLAQYLPGKKIHYLKPADSNSTWIEFTPGGEVRVDGFKGQGKYVIESDTANVILNISEGNKAEIGFRFTKVPVEPGDSVELTADNIEAKVTEISSTSIDRAILPPPEKLKINLPFNPDQLRARANAGEAEAQALLARCLFRGWGLRVDEQKALEWASKAADQGNRAGKFQKARILIKAIRIPRDELVAREILEEILPAMKLAAEEGNPWAQSRLAYCYKEGAGVEKDEDKYLELIQKSAEVDPYAQRELALAYINGNLGGKNDAEAVKWKLKAAQQGCSRAINMLAINYMTDVAVEEDKPEGARLFHAAAQMGNPSAMGNFAGALRNGRGIDNPNPTEADYWQELAAENGMPRAQINLAYRLYKGTDGTSQTRPQPPNQTANTNLVKAYMWYYVGGKLAKNSQGRTSAQSGLSRLSRTLTANQIAEAKAQAHRKFPNLSHLSELKSSSYATLTEAMHAIASAKRAARVEIDQLATLQTNLNTRVQAMALYTLSVVAPEKIDRKISRALDERYHKRFGALPENGKNLNLLENRYHDTFMMSFVGDINGLARLQAELLDSTNPSNSMICERLAKVLLMRDPGKELIKTANTLADKSIELGQQSRYLHWNHSVKAFAEYRAGNFEESKKWSETVLNAPEDVRKHFGNVAPCWFFKAAALQKSNQTEAAQEAFAMGQKVLQNTWDSGRPVSTAKQNGTPLRWNVVEKRGKVPSGWRLCTVREAETLRLNIVRALGQWWMAELDGGKISGSGYEGKIEKGNFPELGHMVIVATTQTATSKSGNNLTGYIHDWLLIKQLEKEISAVLHPPGEPPKEE